MTQHTQTRDNAKMAYLSDQQSERLEALADLLFETSQSATIGELVDNTYERTFGDLDVGALLENRIDPDTIQALADGTLTADELDLDDDVRSDTTAVATAPDGGAKPHPTSYSPTQPGVELRQSGRQLSWDELREAVADERWSEAVEIHSDRVGRETLRANHKITGRVLVAIARHENDRFVETDDLRKLAHRYVTHLTKRFDKEEGVEYVVDTYVDVATSLDDGLFRFPNPGAEVFFTDKADWRERLIDVFDASLESLTVDITSYKDNIRATKREYGTDEVTLDQRTEVTKDWMTNVAKVRYLARKYPYELNEHVELAERHKQSHADIRSNRPSIYGKKLAETLINRFGNVTGPKLRGPVVLELDEDDPAVLEELNGVIDTT